MKNLFLRTITGAAYAGIITGAVLYGSYAFFVLFSLVIVLCLWEFYGLINDGGKASINRYINCIGGVLLFAATYLFATKTVGTIIFLPYLCYVVFMFVAELYQKQEDPITHLAYTFLGQCYIALPISMLSFIAFNDDSAGSLQYCSTLVLSLFVFIWVNDTGAYLVGVTCGKHRLFERISPKKSWEGFLGGLVLTVLAAVGLSYLEPKVLMIHWIGISVLVVVFGTWGDLVESLIKRTLGVKDSGHSLPGHGGYLDRFDSILLAVYGILFYIELFKIKC